MYYKDIQKALQETIEASSWEQVLFALSQMATEVEEEYETEEMMYLTSKYSKLADELHNLSNLMG